MHFKKTNDGADQTSVSQLSQLLRKSWGNRKLAAKLPSLLVIGAQKAGTSALFAYLAQHPNLVAAQYKELDFFGSDLRFSYGLKWYASQWNIANVSGAIRFESSPQYLFSQKAAERIHRCLPDVKLVAILRDPVLRAFSAWQMYRQQLADDPHFYRKHYSRYYSPEESAAIQLRSVDELNDFELAVRREVRALERGQSMEWSVVELGLYGTQLRRYFDRFRRDQILVLESHDLRTSRVESLNRVLQFVGLPSWDWSNAHLADVFVGRKSSQASPSISEFLRQYYKESNRMLADSLDSPPRFAIDVAGHRMAA